MCEVPRRQASSAFDNHAHFETEDEPGISAFGYPKTNHGWVECVSKSFPGKTYYFNVDTCCSTWHRPVSRFVPTRVSRPLTLMSDDDFLNDAPIEVSDIEDENDYEDEDYDPEADLDLPPDADDVKPPTFAVRDPKESADSKIYAEVLFKLYHCYGHDWNDCEAEDVAPLDCETLDVETSENIASILPQACYSSDSDGSSDSDCDSKSTGANDQSETFGEEENTSETLESDESFVEVPREDTDEFSEFDCLKVLQNSENDSENDVENVSENYLENDSENNSEYESRENPLDISASSATDSDIGSPQMGLSSDDEEEEEEENDDEEAEKYQRADGDGLFSLPRLKAIEYADLSKPRKLRKKKWKKRKANDEESSKTTPNKMIKIVCEVNGVTTVNYDYLAPDLPPGVKMSNLSDSGSSACYDAWYAQRNESANNNCANESAGAAKSFGFLDEPMDFSDPDLSDASSSSSSSSSSSALSASSSVVRRMRARKAFEEASKLMSEANQSRHSFKSSTSSGSSWKNSGESGDDDD